MGQQTTVEIDHCGVAHLVLDILASRAARGHQAFGAHGDAAQSERADRSNQWILESERRL